MSQKYNLHIHSPWWTRNFKHSKLFVHSCTSVNVCLCLWKIIYEYIFLLCARSLVFLNLFFFHTRELGFMHVNLVTHVCCHESCPWPSVRLPPEVALPLHWLSHYTNCYMSPQTTFPMFHFNDYTLTCSQSHTLYNTHSDPSQIYEYF